MSSDKDNTVGAAPADPARPERAQLNPVRRWQIILISIVGAVAVITYLCSLLLDGSSAETLNTVAAGAGFGCAVIGVSFAVIGNKP